MAKCYDDVTMVITSCDRFDLLEATLGSMASWIDEFPHKILIEDSDKDPALFRDLRGAGFKIIKNGHRLGQLESIDRAYALCRTEFILHCEDDWQFARRPNIQAARHILGHGFDDELPFSLVCFRDTTGTKHSKRSTFKDREVLGSLFRYSFQHPYDFNYFSFNPGMLRRDLYQRYGPWAPYGSERNIARLLKGRGRCIVRELPANVTHLGEGRSRVRSPRWWRVKNTLRTWLPGLTPS